MAGLSLATLFVGFIIFSLGASSEQCADVGVFNVQVFGQAKMSKLPVVKALVRVSRYSFTQF